ncbi:Chalcone-flavanone isomerase family protein [Abeliophyllum distichum]|uniref:Chalcone-flavanone isomerase family protein n=1 Tax=Abeliophyllum distichum TaxID=126358 RepID=A0ABD1SCW4_9LAMI
METPSSTRRVTRSHILAAKNSNNGKFEESEKTVTRTRQKSGINQQDRSALIDITNDSPIVGVAMGNLDSPLSTMSKKRINCHSKYTFTPGSGEALLRCQVKTLLQKVEEEAEFSKLPLDKGPLFNLKCLLNSPMNLLAPTPANTPQILNSDELNSAIPSPFEYNFEISQNGEGSESEKDLITRALDFSEKSEGSECSSVVTYQGGSKEMQLCTDDDDTSSIWSIQVNASSNRDDEEEEEYEDEYNYEGEEEEYEDEYDYEGEGGVVEELCEGMRKVNVNEGKTMATFSGKHTRFVYNSDGELQREEEIHMSKGEN